MTIIPPAPPRTPGRMRRRGRRTLAEWVDALLSKKWAKEDGVVIKQISDCPLYVTLDGLRHEIRKRGMAPIVSHGRFVFICHGGPIAMYH